MKKSLQKIKLILNILDVIAKLSAIFGITVFGTLSYFFPDFNKIILNIVFNNISNILIILFIMLFLTNNIIIPKFKIEKRDVPPQEASPSVHKNILTLFILSFLIGFKFVGSETSHANNNDNSSEVNIENENTDEGDLISGNEESLFTEEQESVNEWVPLCYSNIIPIEIWEMLTDDELYYIRNGIFAYSHYKYESGYYDVFDWYDGYIESEHFSYDMLNYYQQANIENIRKVESERQIPQQ